MGSILVQVLQAVTLAGTALGVRTAIHRIGRRYTAHLEEVAGPVMRAVAGISEILVAVLYGAFIAVTEPVGGGAPVSVQIEGYLDTLALFASLIVVVELIRLRYLHHVAEALEPWPELPAEGATA
jgi:hypothetical protein